MNAGLLVGHYHVHFAHRDGRDHALERRPLCGVLGSRSVASLAPEMSLSVNVSAAPSMTSVQPSRSTRFRQSSRWRAALSLVVLVLADSAVDGGSDCVCAHVQCPQMR